MRTNICCICEDKKSCVDNLKVAYWDVTHIANSCAQGFQKKTCAQGFQKKKTCAQGLNYMATLRDYTTDIKQSE